MKGIAEIRKDNAPPPTRRPRKPKLVKAELPYKVVCISLYLTDLEQIDRKVDELKARGYRKANRSLIIRLAMSGFNPGEVQIPEVQ